MRSNTKKTDRERFRTCNKLTTSERRKSVRRKERPQQRFVAVNAHRSGGVVDEFVVRASPE